MDKKLSKIKKTITIVGMLILGIVIGSKVIKAYFDYIDYKESKRVYLYSSSTDKCVPLEATDHVAVLDEIYNKRLRETGEKCNAEANSKQFMFLECRSDDAIWVATIGERLCEQNADVVRTILHENEKMKIKAHQQGEDPSKYRPRWLIKN